MRSLLFALAVLAATLVAAAGKIDHVVVLMLENRAFDHMCGWLTRNNSAIDGLSGAEFNVANGTKYWVSDTCPYINPFDPNHSFNDTTMQLMGSFTGWVNPAPMNGFAQDHFLSGYPEFWTVMQGFSPPRVPAISTLAMEFAIFDRWYSAIPGPTVPNRLYFNSGTSAGHVGGSDIQIAFGFPERTVYDVLNDNNVSWKGYYGDVSDLLYMDHMRELPNLEKLQELSVFFTDAAAGTLPAYSWVSPAFYPWINAQATDQHPDHDVVEGEKLIAQVYAALRASPAWNSTLFIVTYDEHGGFYDHVPPPQNIPNPDGLNAQDSGPIAFNFTRAGVRVCTVMASPLIPRGLVVHEPATPGKHYEHTSIFNSLKNIFPMEDNATLTARTTWAPPFDWVVSLDEPRTDCPTALPTPTDDTPARFAAILAEQRQRPPNGLQEELYGMMERLFGRDGSDFKRFATQEQLAVHMRHHMAELKRRGVAHAGK